ncbi:MAG: hypothetical protein JSU87_15070, partial [Gemmatimonadota bacterium]
MMQRSDGTPGGGGGVLGAELSPKGAGPKWCFCPHRGMLPGATVQMRQETRSVLRLRLIGVS